MTYTAKQCRGGQTCEPRSLAEAVACVAQHSVDDAGNPISLEQLAERLGRKPTYLAKACSPYDDAHPFRADLIIPLTVATHNDRILEYLAHAAGGVFYRPPTTPAAPGADLVKQAGAAMREAGQALESLDAILANGVITKDEATTFTTTAHEAIAAMASLSAAVAAHVEARS